MAVELSSQSSIDNFSQEVKKSSAKQLATDFSSADVLVHELQLGEQLNESVEQTRRADFSLMLAMLADDVREQSQFILPKAEEPKAKQATNASLRKEFNLPEQAPLALSDTLSLKQFNQGQSIVDNDLANIHLSDVMMPKPLAFRNDAKHIDSKVLENTSLLTQLKYQQAMSVDSLNGDEEAGSDNLDNKTINKQLTFNAKAWLDGIQQTLVKAPLLN